MSHLRLRPLTLSQANTLIASLHRHHKPVVGHRFSIGAERCGQLVGAVVVGRPVARMVEQYTVAEVTRLVTDGSLHVCSFLYAAASRAALAMGFEKIQTYILDSEPGTSLKAAGWVMEGRTSGGDWNHSWRKGRRTDQPMVAKQRWSKRLNPPVTTTSNVTSPTPVKKDIGSRTTTGELATTKTNTETPSGL